MVPWKIVYSASSLLTFMGGLAIFLAPISAITATDYWFVKKRHVDVPSLYRKHARYHYHKGANWRAAVAFLISVVPNIPGLANAVQPSVKINTGIRHLYDMNYIWGLFSAAFIYWSLSHFFPAQETLISESILDDRVVHGVEVYNPYTSSAGSGKDEVEISVEPKKRDFETV